MPLTHVVNGKYQGSGYAPRVQVAKETAAKATLIKMGYKFGKLPPQDYPALALIVFPRVDPRRILNLFPRVERAYVMYVLMQSVLHRSSQL